MSAVSHTGCVLCLTISLPDTKAAKQTTAKHKQTTTLAVVVHKLEVYFTPLNIWSASMVLLVASSTDVHLD